MNVTVNEDAKKSKSTYPKLMQHADSPLIVLFTDYNCGSVVNGDQNYKVGYHSQKWDPDFFYTFHGTITLSND